ncbi:ROK family protein [Aporhodopirellula aestuarii]|uniref:ROK family protein n=1 Tax=Aporhodopirellula aestuarii TaxID=2950107 RepID=A0ABT0TXX7_9BACT|nr:ROK family protein [Aporhodopirellula aestuarii]MCM2369326.1 ROK family protein [Aporhodopirellula aestuarii]
MGIYIGVDVGGTTSTVCVGDGNGQLIEITPQFPTRSDEGPSATIADIAAEIVRVLGSNGKQLSDVKMVTIATPGPATCEGVLLSTPNLKHPEWNNCPVRELLEKKLREEARKDDRVDAKIDGGELSVRYLGDGQAAALGEFAVRRGDIQVKSEIANRWNINIQDPEADLNSLFMVAVGTGLGGGEVRNREVVRGSEGRAGHAGHIMLPVDVFRYQHDQELQVGNAFSTVESAVSLTALTHQLAYRLELDQWKKHSLHQVDGTAKDRAKRLRELAADGDELALELFDDQATALGVALLMIQYIGDFDDLVIGGGVCDLAPNVRDRYLAKVKKAFYQRALDGFRSFDAISFSHCGDQASVIGAYVDAMS